MIGERFCSNNGTWATVVDYKRSKDVTILFEYDQELTEEPIYGYNRAMQWLREGDFRGPYCKSVQGVGYIGVGPHEIHKGSASHKAYKVWMGMMSRAAGEARLANPKLKSYWDVTVHEEWHNFQNFADWYYKQIGSDLEGWELDKDLFSRDRESKIYSAFTCALLPREINNGLPKKRSQVIPHQSLDTFEQNILKYQDVLNSEVTTKLTALLRLGRKCFKKEVRERAKLEKKLAKQKLADERSALKIKPARTIIDDNPLTTKEIIKETRLEKRRREIRAYIKARHGK